MPQVRQVLIRSAGSLPAFVRGVLGFDAIFGDDLAQDAALAMRLADQVARLLEAAGRGAPVPVGAQGAGIRCGDPSAC
jgi:hypothetical protein